MRLNCAVKSIDHYNGDTRRLLLSVPEDVSFKAGQYLEIILPQKSCPFSIANAPHVNGTIELHIRPTPDSEDSAMIEDMLNNATELEIDVPKGDCFLDQVPDQPLILLAASTGITQMKSIFEWLIGTEGYLSRDPQPVYLYWGVLSADDLYLKALCADWEEHYPHFHFIPVVSEPEGSPDWNGRTGLVGDAVLADFEDLSDVQVVVSGGPGMVYATLDSFVARGMPEGNMRSDIFSYAPRPK